MPESEAEAKEIISKLDSYQKEASDEFASHLINQLQRISNKEESLEDKENKAIIGMRGRWSNTILCLIVVIVIFDMILVWLIGIKVWSYDNPSIIVAIITDNFLKIAGLGYLITTELFKKIFPRY